MLWYEYLTIIISIVFVGLVIGVSLHNKHKGSNACASCHGICSSSCPLCVKLNKALDNYKQSKI